MHNIDERAYPPGPLLADVSLNHATSAVSAIMMSGLAVAGWVLRQALRTVNWISVLLRVNCLLNARFRYPHG
jgi:cation:H+ antiporter